MMMGMDDYDLNSDDRRWVMMNGDDGDHDNDHDYDWLKVTEQDRVNLLPKRMLGGRTDGQKKNLI